MTDLPQRAGGSSPPNAGSDAGASPAEYLLRAPGLPPTGSGPAPAPGLPAAADASPPSLLQLLQETLKAPFAPGPVFGGTRGLPTPGFGILLANVLVWNGAAFALHAVLGAPRGAGSASSLAAYAVAAVAIPMVAAASFVSAGLIHLLARLSGGQGRYAQAYHIISLLSLLATVGALAEGTPLVQAAVGAYAFVLAGVAVWLVYGAPGHQVGIVFAAAGALLLAGQRAARYQLEAWRAAWAPPTAAETAFSGPAPPAIPAAGANPAGAAPMQAPPGVDPRQLQQALDLASSLAGQAAAAASAASSGLDMVRRGSVDAAGAAPGAEASGGAPLPTVPGIPTPQEASRFTPDQMRQAQQSQFAMIQTMQKLLANPAMTKSMSPQETERMRQIQQMLATVSTLYQQRSQSGQRAAGMTDAERQRLMGQLQGVMGSLREGSPARGHSSDNADLPLAAPRESGGMPSNPSVAPTPPSAGAPSGLGSPLPLPPSDSPSGQ